MKPFVSLLVLSLASLSSSALAQSPIAGDWQGVATVRGGGHVPITLRITGSGPSLHLALLNGPASHPEESAASSVTFSGSHLVAVYDYYTRKLDATLTGTTLSGTFGTFSPTNKSTPVEFTATRVPHAADPTSKPGAPDITGDWEIATTGSKGESAWQFRVEPATPGTPILRSVIQRIDGDTGALWALWDGTSYNLTHLTAAGAALYSVTPKPDGTLLVRNLIPPAEHPDAGPAEYIARRPSDARALNLTSPPDPTQQTSVKDPSVPFAFSFPDLAGHTVANTDPQFRHKVVIVAIGGSWCPNCHDEAPMLVNLYKRFHSQGLEIVGLDFETGDPDTDLPRLKAFLARYNIPYTTLLAGNTDQLNEKIPQGVNLNCWPTSFFLGRDGLVKEVHAGYAGPGNPAGHVALERETTALVERLLAQSTP